VGASVLLLFFARLASLHALEQSRGRPFWRCWLGTEVPSADSVGRIMAQMDPEPLRLALREIVQRMRRKKAWPCRRREGGVLILDGHESSSSLSRHCLGCLERTHRTARRERIQYYHRNVSAMLRAGSSLVLIDTELQKPGEGEVATASRVFERLVASMGSAFEVVVVDALYVQAPFFRLVLGRNKHILAVLKNEERELMEDARALFAHLRPTEMRRGNTRALLWDQEGFRSWSSLGRPVRVVRSLETTRKRNGQSESSEWFWVTTLPRSLAPTERIVELGHARWQIENEGFNELVNHWHLDHVFRHHPTAILTFTLMAFLARNLFHLFIGRNLKPPLRDRFTNLHWARCMMGELYEGDWSTPLTRPP
jgi:hypothetical protein